MARSYFFLKAEGGHAVVVSTGANLCQTNFIRNLTREVFPMRIQHIRRVSCLECLGTVVMSHAEDGT